MTAGMSGGAADRSRSRMARLGYGCMRICGDGSPAARERGKAAVRAAVAAGFTLFDHADVYGGGECERLFGEVLAESPGMRERIAVQTKCGIRLAGEPDADAPARYDFSRRHILDSVERSLERLGIERIDVLLLHRPDYLADWQEAAAAFDELSAAGKVARFGVSNFSAARLAVLQSMTEHRLAVNQLEINLHNVDALTDGTLDRCRELAITPQAWCPLAGVAYPAWGNTFGAAEQSRLRAEVDRQAAHYGVEGWQIALAWLLLHPARIVPIVGSTTPARIAAAPRALDVPYTREDWYRLLEARNGRPVP